MNTKWDVQSLVAFETKAAELFKQGKINCPLHLSGGNETMLIDIFKHIKEEDYVFSTHRNHYHYLLKGGDPDALLGELQGLPSGPCGGSGRSMHIFDTKLHFYTSAIVGGCCAPACGVALGIKQRRQADGNTIHVWCFVGDGCEDSGYFTEAIRFAYGRSLPITFIVEDNDFSINTTKSKRWHSYVSINNKYIIRYHYKRTWPHVGVGSWVTF